MLLSDQMVSQILMGAAVSVCNIAIHATVMLAILAVLHLAERTYVTQISSIDRRHEHDCGDLDGHALCRGPRLVVGLRDRRCCTPSGTDLIYFAFVNYTTLGYGDVTPVARWNLLGPMTAMNGVLLFGWSTAVIFEVLRRTLGRPQR
jgi:hypothetical protein